MKEGGGLAGRKGERRKRKEGRGRRGVRGGEREREGGGGERKKRCERERGTTAKQPTLQYLFHPHHGLHELCRIAQGDSCETAIPANQFVVDIATHETQHVGEVWLQLLDQRGRNPTHQQRQSVNLDG